MRAAIFLLVLVIAACGGGSGSDDTTSRDAHELLLKQLELEAMIVAEPAGSAKDQLIHQFNRNADALIEYGASTVCARHRDPPGLAECLNRYDRLTIKV